MLRGRGIAGRHSRVGGTNGLRAFIAAFGNKIYENADGSSRDQHERRKERYLPVADVFSSS
jgi:hypothetical protein